MDVQMKGQLYEWIEGRRNEGQEEGWWMDGWMYKMMNKKEVQ